MEILGKLGIDWKLLVAQLVNFGLLLLILHRFVYKPLLGVLEKRASTIEKSLADARAIEERLKEAEQSKSDILIKARQEAAVLMEEVARLAEQRRVTALEKAKQEVAQVIEDAKAEIAREKQAMLSKAKEQFGELVVKAAQVVIQHGLDKEIPADLVEKVVSKAKQSLETKS